MEPIGIRIGLRSFLPHKSKFALKKSWVEYFVILSTEYFWIFIVTIFYWFFKIDKNILLSLAYRNAWTLNASVERWTLDSGHWMLHFGRWALNTGHCRWLFQNRVRTQFLILLDSIIENYLGANLYRPHGHACSAKTIGSDVAIFRLSYAERNFYCKKLNYITSSYLGPFRSSHPQPFIFENFFREYWW